jgi:hypothetical protein
MYERQARNGEESDALKVAKLATTGPTIPPSPSTWGQCALFAIFPMATHLG